MISSPGHRTLPDAAGGRGRRVALLLALLAAPLAPLLARAQTDPAPSKWEAEIRAFEAADKAHPPPRNGVVFVGSSSIRLWKTLESDFPEFKVLNRGFGGSQLADSVALAGRLILPYRPRMIVLYAGDNDIAAGKSAEEVAADFGAFVARIEAELPEARIAFISIKPSPARWKFADTIRRANQMIQAACRKRRRLVYIDVFSPMLGPDGQPRPELFVEDRLHMNSAGYALWTRLVKPHLEGPKE